MNTQPSQAVQPGLASVVDVVRLAAFSDRPTSDTRVSADRSADECALVAARVAADQQCATHEGRVQDPVGPCNSRRARHILYVAS